MRALQEKFVKLHRALSDNFVCLQYIDKTLRFMLLVNGNLFY